MQIGSTVLPRYGGRTVDLIVEEVQRESETLRGYVTSVGTLQERVHSVPSSPMWPFWGAEFKIRSLEDIRIYRHIWENTWCEADYEPFLREEAYVGDDGLAAVGAPQSAVQFLLGQEAGLSNFYYLLQDYTQEMEGLLETIHERIREAYQIIARSPARVVFAMEDTSSTTSSPAIFERYSWRHLNEYADVLLAEGKIFLAHMCGHLKAMASLIAESNLDGVESLTPAPIGDLDPAEARSIWGEEKIIIGGIDADTMLNATPEELRRYVQRLLARMAPGRKFILSNADSMPFGVSVDNLRAISEFARGHGKYPLVKG